MRTLRGANLLADFATRLLSTLADTSHRYFSKKLCLCYEMSR